MLDRPTSAILLLRGVNVGGKQTIRMAELCALMDECGCQYPKSLLQSGNVVFRTAEAASSLEPMLEQAILRRLGLQVECFVRNLPEWEAIVARNPFPLAARETPDHLLLTVLRGMPEDGAVEALRAAITGRESVQADGANLYLTYPDGIGRSRLTNAWIERRLGVTGTARNWNTVLKILALLRPETT
jgi:uncharacterized protein (DUF1697 family)